MLGNLPANYKQQELEARVAAQRKKKRGKITAKQNFGGYENRYMSYPIARSNQEKTGDTLRIKCIQYVPSNGKNFGVEVENALEDVYKVGKDGKEKFDRTQFIPKSRRTKPISIKTTFTDANTRISKANQQNQLTKFNIELPIPQEINDSQSVLSLIHI